MREKSLTKLLMSAFTAFFVAVAGGWIGVEGCTENQYGPADNLQEVTFTLTRQPENSRFYSLVISDDQERTISGSFSIDQLQILRAIMTEAEKFAFTGEAAGTKEPITTRFMDKQESAFIVDVEKLGPQSRLFITLKTEVGRMTLNAGRIIRSSRREEGLFFELLSRLESLLPKLPGQPSK